MKFLNLDLDFFIDDIVYMPRGLRRRANKALYRPWSAEAVRLFLERQCGLNREKRIPGKLGVHHHEVFDYWRDLLNGSGEKLDVTHVDAHGDFAGALDSGVFSYLQGELLSYPVGQRLNQIDRNRRHLTLANYMSFAVACRWIERIEFVTHPKTPESGDPYDSFFRDKNPATGLLELRLMDGNRVLGVEPPVSFWFTPGKEFAGANFSHAFLSQSPNYTPSTADPLIAVFREYIDF